MQQSGSNPTPTDIGLAIYTHDRTALSEIHSKVGHQFDHIHFDLVDASVRPSAESIDLTIINKARKLWPEKYAMLHLMSKHPMQWLENCINDVDAILFDENSDCKPDMLINFCHKRNKKAGLAIHNKTDIREFASILPKLDYLLILAIETPGISGQHMRAGTVELCSRLSDLQAANQFKLIIDGGVTPELAVSLSADHLITASALLNSQNPSETYQLLKLPKRRMQR